jgi:hypothetical protein
MLHMFSNGYSKQVIHFWVRFHHAPKLEQIRHRHKCSQPRSTVGREREREQCVCRHRRAASQNASLLLKAFVVMPAHLHPKPFFSPCHIDNPDPTSPSRLGLPPLPAVRWWAYLLPQPWRDSATRRRCGELLKVEPVRTEQRLSREVHWDEVRWRNGAFIRNGWTSMNTKKNGSLNGDNLTFSLPLLIFPCRHLNR